MRVTPGLLPGMAPRAEDEALRELPRLARDPPDGDADEAWRRLGRLTAGQRAFVVRTLTRHSPW